MNYITDLVNKLIINKNDDIIKKNIEINTIFSYRQIFQIFVLQLDYS
jgi:hypothetical protein